MRVRFLSKYLYGLDISLKNTGITIYDLEKKEFIYIGSFNTEKIYATKEYKGLEVNAVKLKKIVDWLKPIILKYPPNIIAIERMFSRYPTETQVIAKATGVVQCMLWNKPQYFYPPKTVKLAMVHGDATKEDVANCIKAKYNDVSFSNEDESDSFAVALTFLIDTELITWEKPKWSDIKKLRKPLKEQVKKLKKVTKKKETNAKNKKKS